VARTPADEQVRLQLRILERIGDVHYASGAISESVAAYEKQTAVASGAALAVEHGHALMCEAVPLGLIDPDRGVELMERASRVSERVGEPFARRARLMTAVWRLLYRGWDRTDFETFTSIRSRVESLTENDEMFCMYVHCLAGDPARAARVAGVQAREATSLMGYLGATGVNILALFFLGRFGEALQIV